MSRSTISTRTRHTDRPDHRAVAYCAQKNPPNWRPGAQDHQSSSILGRLSILAHPTLLIHAAPMCNEVYLSGDSRPSPA